ncbi:MAG TPA: Flp family type IVb pilin [Gemmataceae bacterium]|nr:Flp family type IVb pilin [Gemmataceae bacterium]
MKQVVAAARRLRNLAEAKYLGVKNFLAKREAGASLVEYALLVALIALIAIAGIKLLGTNIGALFNNIAANL